MSAENGQRVVPEPAVVLEFHPGEVRRVSAEEAEETLRPGWDEFRDSIAAVMGPEAGQVFVDSHIAYERPGELGEEASPTQQFVRFRRAPVGENTSNQ